MTLRQALAGGCLVLAAGGWATGVRADDPAAPPPEPAPAPAAPVHAFVPWRAELRPGTPVRAPGLLLVPILREEAKQDVVPGAHVGLHGVAVDVMDLPQPAGSLYVRLTNRSEHPVEVTVGEALVTPDGPARIVSRPVYLPPGASTMAPTAPGLDVRVIGPYVSRGLGLSPREQALLDARTWPAELRARSEQFGVEPTRLLDASAAYLTELFQAQAAPYEARLAALRTPRCVGVAAFDERGLAYARVCGDAARFQDQLVFLERELVLDALRNVTAGRRARDVGDAALQADLRALLDGLDAAGVARQSFAGAALHRWELPGRDGRWEGLSVEGRPWSLTWRLRPPTPPAPVVQPNPPPTPPQPPEGDDDVTVLEVDRRARPTPFEERWRERRPDGAGGAGGRNPGGTGGAGGAGGTGGAGGNTPGGSGPSAGGGGGLGGGGLGGGGGAGGGGVGPGGLR